MIYTWINDNKKEVEVHRSVSKYDTAPTYEECSHLMDKDEYDKSTWSRKLTGGSFVQGFAAVGKGGKGNWGA